MLNKKATKDNNNKNDISDNNTNDIKDDDENKELNSAIVSLDNNIDGFTENLKVVQDNTFSSINNNLYMSGNYNNSIVTTQGDLQIK